MLNRHKCAWVSVVNRDWLPTLIDRYFRMAIYTTTILETSCSFVGNHSSFTTLPISLHIHYEFLVQICLRFHHFLTCQFALQFCYYNFLRFGLSLGIVITMRLFNYFFRNLCSRCVYNYDGYIEMFSIQFHEKTSFRKMTVLI